MTTLYRKYRPQKLSEIIGQEHITHALTKQLEKGKVHHAYLFAGPKGTGKTSTARIIAKAVNCRNAELRIKNEELRKTQKRVEPCNKCDSCKAIVEGRHLDLIEIDAASNRGIDDVRELREGVKLAPSSGKYKVYIIDEAHMLTPEAFNALLKTLEEPPPHVIFILATTEPQKLPGTIVSRTQRFDFQRPDIENIQKRLKVLVKNEGWKIDDESLAEIAKSADGAFRDAEVLLEKIGSVNPRPKKEEVLQIVGKKNTLQVLEIMSVLEEKDAKKSLIWLDEYVESGGNIRVLNEAIIDSLRKILLIKTGVGDKLVKGVTPEEYTKLKKFAAAIDSDRLSQLIKLFTRSTLELAMASIPQLPLELAFVEACDFQAGTEGGNHASGNSAVSKPETEENESSTADNKNQEDTNPPKTEGTTEKPSAKPALREHLSDDKLLKNVTKAWPKILKEVKDKNKSLEVFLRACEPVSVEDNNLFLKFYYRFHKERVEDPKNRGILEPIIEEEVATPVKIKGVMGEKPAAKSKKEPSSENIKEETDAATIFGSIE